MLIDRIYQKVKSFVNTEIRGNVSPSEFNLFLHDAIQDRYEELLPEINRFETRNHRGLTINGAENLADKTRDKLLHYLTPHEEIFGAYKKFDLPCDANYLYEVETEDGVTFERSKNMHDFNISKNCATEKYPIYTVTGTKLKTSHEFDTILITYLRQPKFPKWTYEVVLGNELFNPNADDFQDADIHASEEDEITRRVLLRFGVNLKEPDIISVADKKEEKEFNENITT